MVKSADSRIDRGGEAGAARGRGIARDQLREWREIMAWSDGEGLDPATVSNLLDEVERLQAELAAARRKLAGNVSEMS
jgi:hypothetical protein